MKYLLLPVVAFAVFGVSAEIRITAPAEGETMPLLTDAQKAYVRMDRATRRVKFAEAKFRKSEMGMPAERVPGEKEDRKPYWPKTVRLAWEGADGDCRVKVVDVKKKEVVFEGTAKDHVDIDNLEIAADYEWVVADGKSSAKGTFKTEDMAPRLLRFPGVNNVRDLGGRIGLGGKRIRQGLVIRSAGLNDNAGKEYYTMEELRSSGKQDEIAKATESTKVRLEQLLKWQADPKTMDLEDEEYKEWCTRHRGEPPTKFLSSRVRRAKDAVQNGVNPKIPKGPKKGKNRVEGANGEYIRARFGIKSDIDLRSDGECWGMEGSPLGPTVTWYHYSSSAYGGMQSSFGRTQFTKVFKVFLDEKNYPIDFHCIAGQDRTGAVAFILEGLLGVDEDVLYLDWETTGFWNRGNSFCHERLFDGLVRGFNKSYPGKSLAEACEAYVLSLGFTADDIAKFRKIMIED